MEFEEFAKELMEKLQKMLGDGHMLMRRTADGLNGTKKNSLLVVNKKSGADIFPCIRLDDFYKKFTMGVCMDRILDEIAEACQRNGCAPDMDISRFARWDMIQNSIFGKLVNTEKNGSFLKGVPHRGYLDLSIVYYAGLHTGKGEEFGVVQVQKEHMELWGVDEDALYASAMKNMEGESCFDSIENIIRRLAGEEGRAPIMDCPEIPMFILSNKLKVNGAAQICNAKAMKEIAGYLDGDFWILPSSIHEVILVPSRQGESRGKEFAEIVRDVNDGQLEPQEILSYHVYRYHRGTEEITIEA